MLFLVSLSSVQCPRISKMCCTLCTTKQQLRKQCCSGASTQKLPEHASDGSLQGRDCECFDDSLCRLCFHDLHLAKDLPLAGLGRWLHMGLDAAEGDLWQDANRESK